MRTERIYIIEFGIGLFLSALGGSCFYYSYREGKNDAENSHHNFWEERMNFEKDYDIVRFTGSGIVTSLGIGLLASGARAFNRKI